MIEAEKTRREFIRLSSLATVGATLGSSGAVPRAAAQSTAPWAGASPSGGGRNDMRQRCHLNKDLPWPRLGRPRLAKLWRFLPADSLECSYAPLLSR
jgi:hypothetical protein